VETFSFEKLLLKLKLLKVVKDYDVIEMNLNLKGSKNLFGLKDDNHLQNKLLAVAD